MQNQKPKPSRAKSLFGGLIAVGIFASFFVFNHQSTPADNLTADIVAVQTTESPVAETTDPEITIIAPASGAVGEIVIVVVKNLNNLTRDTGGIFFGETPAEIETIDQAADGTLTVFTHAPELTELGNYKIKITTPNQVLTSTLDFELTSLSALAPAPTAETAEPAAPTAETPATANPIADTLNTYADTNTSLTMETPGMNDLLTNDQGPLEPNDPAPPEPDASEPEVTAPVFAGEPPRNLAATMTSGGIELDWEAPLGGTVDHFNIYYGTTSGKYLHRVAAQNLFAVLNSSFASETTYYFMVSAVFADGSESAGSNETAAIYSAAAVTNVNLAHASAQPQKLSEQGPAETLAVAIFVALGFSGWLFRRKIFVRN
ncbi:MAG: hypothetical protein WCV72_00380 [Patescibacteria group bacterium]